MTAVMTTQALLEIRGLSVTFPTARGPVLAVDEVTLPIKARECIALVGESGSGKTQLMLAAIGLLPRSACTAGQVLFEGRDLLSATDAQRDDIRGKRIGFVFQNPLSALTPHLQIGEQIVEVMRHHLQLDRNTARQRALQLLDRVRMDAPARRLRQYPHELSGGLRQRAMLAIALAAQPDLLIADEPTAALDVTVQAELLDLLAELKSSLGIVLITHDFGVAARLCDRIAVMYAGRIVEEGVAGEVFGLPRHPYTRLLLDALPRLDAPTGQALATVGGQPPGPHEPRAPCAFAPRCPRADQICMSQRPRLLRSIACHHPHAA